MNVGLGWLGVAVGAVGCVATYLMSGGVGASRSDEDTSRSRGIAWLAAGVALAITLVLWAIAMESRAPFSPGQGLAWGFLIGGVTGTVAILLSFRLSEIVGTAGALRSSRLASLSNVFLALFAVSLAYSLFASNPWDVLMGFSMGAAMAAILHFYMQHAVADLPVVRTDTWALFAITIAAAILLSMRHFDMTQQRMWWALPILIATSLSVANYIAIELSSIGGLKDKPGAGFLIGALIAGVLVAGLSAIYSSSVVHTWELLGVVGVGLVLGGVICWLTYALVRGAGVADGLEAGAACVLLIVAFATVAFKLWSGLGIALGMLGIWAIAVAGFGIRRTDHQDEPHSLTDLLTWPLIFGLAVVMFRVFLEQYARGLRTTDLQVHYTFIGALLGATTPFVFSAALIRMREANVGRLALLGVLLMGLMAAASPLLILVLWEIKAVMGFVFGLIAAVAFMMYARLSGGDERYSAGLLAIASQLTAIQFVGPLAGVEITRGVRIAVLAVAVVLAVAWLGLSSLCAARRAR